MWRGLWDLALEVFSPDPDAWADFCRTLGGSGMDGPDG